MIHTFWKETTLKQKGKRTTNFYWNKRSFINRIFKFIYLFTILFHFSTLLYTILYYNRKICILFFYRFLYRALIILLAQYTYIIHVTLRRIFIIKRTQKIMCLNHSIPYTSLYRHNIFLYYVLLLLDESKNKIADRRWLKQKQKTEK